MTDCTELRRLAKAAIIARNEYDADECNAELADEQAAADDAFHDAAGPDEVLALIAENEALKSDCRRLRSDITAWRLTVTAERANRDAYKSELERLTGTAFAEELAALRKGAGRYEWLRDKDYLHLWSEPLVCDQPRRAIGIDKAIDAAMGKGEQS